MKVLFYKDKPINLDTMISIGSLNVRVTEELVAYNKQDFIYQEVEYVKLTNIPPWSIKNEYTGEVFELSTLDNLSKFSFAPTKEEFMRGLSEWLLKGSFIVTNKTEFVAQERRRLVEEAAKRGLLDRPKYLKYPWQDPSLVRDPIWNNSGVYINQERTIFTYDGVRIYSNGQWASIATAEFKTHDGYYVNKGDKIFVVNINDLQVTPLILKHWRPCSSTIAFFNEDAMKQYVKEHSKSKTLADYEKILLKRNEHFDWLKHAERKLYWTGVLLEIAKDFNGTTDPIIGTKYFIAYDIWNDPTCLKHETVDYGLVYFKNAQDAIKAATLLGDNLAYIIPKYKCPRKP